MAVLYIVSILAWRLGFVDRHGTERIRERKVSIGEPEWRAITLGRRYLDEQGIPARDGRPASCMIPAP